MVKLLFLISECFKTSISEGAFLKIPRKGENWNELAYDVTTGTIRAFGIGYRC